MGKHTDAKAGRSDYLVKVMTDDKDILAAAATSTGLVEHAARMHGTWPTATAALGRALTGCGLMASLLDPEQRVAIRLQGGGPLGAVFAEGDGTGAVRGYVSSPRVDLPSKNGKLDVSGALGTDGFLTVTKDLGFKDPYRGIVALYNGEVAADIASYYAESEQIPSAVGLGVFVDKDGGVTAAGGFLLQTLPGGADDGRIDEVISRIESMDSISSQIREGRLPEDMLQAIFGPIPFHVIEERGLFYRCSCSRARIEQAIVALGPEDIRHILEERESVEITCQFCNKTYTFQKPELSRLLEEMA